MNKSNACTIIKINTILDTFTTLNIWWGLMMDTCNRNIGTQFEDPALSPPNINLEKQIDLTKREKMLVHSVMLRLMVSHPPMELKPSDQYRKID